MWFQGGENNSTPRRWQNVVSGRIVCAFLRALRVEGGKKKRKKKKEPSTLGSRYREVYVLGGVNPSRSGLSHNVWGAAGVISKCLRSTPPSGFSHSCMILSI